MASLKLSINGTELDVDIREDDIPLLWVLRDNLGLVGSKFGCGGGFCGACTVHVEGRPMRSCSIKAKDLVGKQITTIEGLATDNETLHALQDAWIAHDVPQCGYCQAGQLMTAASLLASNSNPSSSDIDMAMSGNICRCGTYNRIRDAIKTAATNISKGGAA
jgi:isoquinoline 1-oxidoreductase alpha subunit